MICPPTLFLFMILAELFHPLDPDVAKHTAHKDQKPVQPIHKKRLLKQEMVRRLRIDINGMLRTHLTRNAKQRLRDKILALVIFVAIIYITDRSHWDQHRKRISRFFNNRRCNPLVTLPVECMRQRIDVEKNQCHDHN